MSTQADIISPDTADPRTRVESFRRCVPFGVGRIIITPGARAALATSGEDAGRYLVRHRTGYWNETPADERAENMQAVRTQRGSVLSHHRLRNGARLWVATEADRSRTTIFIPEEAGVSIFNECEERAA